MIYTGKLNRRITFQRLEAKEDEMGQNKSVWQDYKTIWGSVKLYGKAQTRGISQDICAVPE